MKWKLLAVATIVVAALIAGGLIWFDKPLLLWMRGLDCRFWRILGVMFDDKIWAAIFAGFVLGVYIKKTMITGLNYKNINNRFSLRSIFVDFWQKTSGNRGFLIFCSIFVAGGLVWCLKALIGRARPILFEALDFTGFYPPSFDWVFNSMPSGHTAVSFAALVMIGMLAPRVKPLTWTLAILIGVSRVCVGAHWPTDVILGGFIGMVVADIVKWRMLRNK